MVRALRRNRHRPSTFASGLLTVNPTW